MNKLVAKSLLITIGSGLLASHAAQPPKTLYENSFEKEEVGKVPSDFLVLDGGFAVQQEQTNKFLQLPGAPLDTFAVLFGPNELENISVSARIFGTGKGRRYPAFAVGSNGFAGFKLQVTPAKKAIELFKDELLLATVPYAWDSGQWTHLRLQIRKRNQNERWIVEGKVWPDKSAEPGLWLISAEIKETPPTGKSLVAGFPFSGTPIRFDDLKVTRAQE